jgi:uncharacterized LabA/DUF88 family protein
LLLRLNKFFDPSEHIAKRIFAMKGNFYESERVALFIDGANLYSAARSLGFDIDYRRLLKVFREKGRLVRAYYYTALIEDQEYSPIRPLIDWLDYNGYTMVTKPTKEFTDAMGRRKIKGNMDIELAIDVLEMAEHLDHVILRRQADDFIELSELAPLIARNPSERPQRPATAPDLGEEAPSEHLMRSA